MKRCDFFFIRVDHEMIVEVDGFFVVFEGDAFVGAVKPGQVVPVHEGRGETVKFFRQMCVMSRVCVTYHHTYNTAVSQSNILIR